MLNVGKLIDQAVVARSEAKGAKRSASHFHVSDAGLCYRKRFLKRMGVPPTRLIPPGALRKMLAGEGGHEILQETLQGYGALFAAELEVRTEDILGHFDAIVKDGDHKVLLEFKTVEKWSMGHIKKDGPKPEHIMQMFTYWTMLRRDFTYLNQATLVYLMREDFQNISFDYLWDREVATRVSAEWSPLLGYWMRGELPPCTCNKDYGGSGISYCQYQAPDKESCCSATLFNP